MFVVYDSIWFSICFICLIGLVWIGDVVEGLVFMGNIFFFCVLLLFDFGSILIFLFFFILMMLLLVLLIWLVFFFGSEELFFVCFMLFVLVWKVCLDFFVCGF